MENIEEKPIKIEMMKDNKNIHTFMQQMNRILVQNEDNLDVLKIVVENKWLDLDTIEIDIRERYRAMYIDLTPRMHSVYNYACEHFNYDGNIYQHYEPIKSPIDVLLNRDTQCYNSFDLSLALAILLRNACVCTKFRVVNYPNLESEFLNHCYVMAYNYIKAKWTALDPILGIGHFGEEIKSTINQDFDTSQMGGHYGFPYSI